MSPAGRPGIANVLSLAGSDPSGGAGIQADLKTFAACGVYGMAVPTAIVVQNTVAVRRVQPLPAALVEAQLQAVLEDVRVDALKIGMLGGLGTMRRLPRLLASLRVPLVLDPVLVASAGGVPLLPATALPLLRALWLPQVTVLTPNLAEAAALLGWPPGGDEAWMRRAARALRELGPTWVWLKGGHRPDQRCADLLAGPDSEDWLEGPRITGPYGHGTGCTLSAAMAAALTAAAPRQAARQARGFLQQALAQAPQLSVGHGRGPLHHGHGLGAAALDISVT